MTPLTHPQPRFDSAGSALLHSLLTLGALWGALYVRRVIILAETN